MEGPIVNKALSTDVIASIQREYYHLLASHFIKERRAYAQSGMSVDSFAAKHLAGVDSQLIIRQGLRSRSPLEYKLFSLFGEIDRFWEFRKQSLASALKTSKLLVLNIDLDTNLEFVPKALAMYGLYFDIVSMLDPFYLCTTREFEKSSRVTFQTCKRFFEIYLLLFDVLAQANSDSGLPLLIVYPSDCQADSAEIVADPLFESGESVYPVAPQVLQRVCWHLSRILKEHIGVTIESNKTQDFLAFSAETNYFNVSKEKLVPLIDLCLVSNMSLNSFRYGKPMFSSGFARAAPEIVAIRKSKETRLKLSGSTLSFLLLLLINRLRSAEVAFEDCMAYGMENHISAASWALYNKKLSNESTEIKRVLEIPTSTALLYAFETRLNWLSGLALSDVLRIRQDNRLSESRQLFRDACDALGSSTKDNLDQVATYIEEEVVRHLSDYSLNMTKVEEQTLSRDVRTAESFVSTFSLGLVSLALPQVLPLAIVSFADSIVSGSINLKELYERYHKGERNEEELRHSPITIMAEAYQRNQENEII